MRKIAPIDCEQALQHVFELIDHELKAEQHQAMQQHLETCRSCYSRVQFERRLKARLKTLREAETNVGARARIEKLLKAL